MTLIANKHKRQLVRALSGGGKILAALEDSFLGTPVPTATKTAAYTAHDGEVVPVDTTAAGVTITLPAPTPGALVVVKHLAGANNLTVARNGATIDGAAADIVEGAAGTVHRLVGNAAGDGWLTI